MRAILKKKKKTVIMALEIGITRPNSRDSNMLVCLFISILKVKVVAWEKKKAPSKSKQQPF